MSAPSPAPDARAGGLRFGLPSKGRLQTQIAAFLAERGITLVRSRVDREYAGGLQGLDGVEIVFLSAGEVPDRLSRGEIHLGVTGKDLILEHGGVGAGAPQAEKVALLAPLGFGHADLVVAAPKCWIDVEDMADLDDVAADFRARHGHPLRIATKYRRLARRFFRASGVANYRLVESQGATEGLVASNAAEAIVDITSSGDTLRANHLKMLRDGLILRSEAYLCGSLTADWTEAARAAATDLFGRLSANDQALQAFADRIEQR